MKKIRTVLAITVASLMVAGCATTFKPWKLSDVQEGMERDQVVKILGNPDYTETKNGAEYLYYSFTEDLIPPSSISYDDPEALERRIKELNRTLDEHKYEVVLIDGKMVNYKELKN
ncbi:outer membrane protein assembly factor BamE [Pontiellaceae bacterium B12219]|nr:outer membrane protein assembly factor BamE [Pontiellaceae bacterium B12219]